MKYLKTYKESNTSVEKSMQEFKNYLNSKFKYSTNFLGDSQSQGGNINYYERNILIHDKIISSIVKSDSKFGRKYRLIINNDQIILNETQYYELLREWEKVEVWMGENFDTYEFQKKCIELDSKEYFHLKDLGNLNDDIEKEYKYLEEGSKMGLME